MLTTSIPVKPGGEVQQFLLLRAQRLIAALIWWIGGVRWLRVGGVAVGEGRRWQSALKRGWHRVMFIQKLLQSPDVLHRRPQGLHFAHLLICGAVWHMLTQRLEAHVDLLDSVSLSFVPPGHGHWLLLGDGVAETVEAQSALAAQELRGAGALSFQHLTFTLAAGRAAVWVDSGYYVLGRGMQADACVSFI